MYANMLKKLEEPFEINNDYNLTPEMVEEIKLAIKEANDGNVIPNDRFEEYFCK